jgi:hypothetical protein
VVTQTETWEPIPGFSRYQASDGGLIRSGVTGLTMATNPNNNGYPRLNLVDDGGKKQNVLVHAMILLTFEGPPPAGMEARHWNDDPTDNRWAPGGENACVLGLGNLLYGTKAENVADRTRNRPPRAPKPPQPCINHDRCGGYIGKGGRRCHECVVKLAWDGAELLWGGATLEQAAERLDYPAVHLHTLAVRYAGYGQRPPPPAPPSRSVFATVRARFRRGDAA